MATRTHVMSNRAQARFDSLPSAKPKLGKNAVSRTHVLLGGSSTDLQLLLREWDNGRKEARLRILRAFVKTNQHRTGPELEMEYGNGASLFLTRVTAWLRLTYLLGIDVALQLRVVLIFISAASGHRFLTEFLEVGGVLTVLEVLNLDQLFDEDKIVALRILQTIANTGRSYKELICEVSGVAAVLCALGRTQSELLTESVRLLMITLGRGNPEYSPAIVQSLLSTLCHPSALAQRVAVQILRTLAEERAARVTPGIDWIGPALCMLRTGDLQAQYEAFEMVKMLVTHAEQTSAEGQGQDKGEGKHYPLMHPLLANLVHLLHCETPLHIERQAEADADNVQVGRAVPASLSDFLQEADAFARDSDSGSVAESVLEEEPLASVPDGMTDAAGGPDPAAVNPPLYTQHLGVVKAMAAVVDLDEQFGRLLAQRYGTIASLLIVAMQSKSQQVQRQAVQLVQRMLELCPGLNTAVAVAVGGQGVLDTLLDSDEAFLQATVDDADVVVVGARESTALAPADAGPAGGAMAAIAAYWLLLPRLPSPIEKYAEFSSTSSCLSLSPCVLHSANCSTGS
eukprot:SAG31_NODE_3361_length_4364_cov_3.184291_5_plen_570_part_00